MNTALRNSLIIVLLLLTGLIAFWFVRNFEKSSEEITLPAYGEPTYNALYALRETLIRDGSKAETRRQLDLPAMQLQPSDTVLMLDDPRLLTPAQVESLLDWVQFGGHLLLRVPDADEDLDGNEQGLLERLGVLTSDAAARCQIWQVQGQDSHDEFCTGSRFTLTDKIRADLRWADAGGDDTLAYARLRYGMGRVDVLGSMDFLLNGEGPGDTGLRDIPHRDLARLVLAPNYGKGTTHLIYAMELPSLWKTLFQRGWPVWVPLLLALLAWLWMRCQRFGALLPSPREDRRSLLEHVRASGAHLFRYHKRAPLYFAVRQSFLARLRRRDPVAAALTGEPQVSAIAERLGIPANSVRVALQVPASHDKLAFRDRISTLIQMRNRL